MNANRRKKTHSKKQWDMYPPGQAYFDEVLRISKNHIIFGINYFEWSGVNAGRIIWEKGFAKGMSFKGQEIALCSSIETTITVPILWAGMMQAKSLTNPMKQQGNKKLNEKRIHPCYKPILLYQKLIDLFVPSGSKVYDSHLGGGANRIACYNSGIDFWASEIDVEYFNDQEQNFALFLEQKKLSKKQLFFEFPLDHEQ